MYNDFRHMTRLDWKFRYLGKELVKAAQKKLEALQAKEMETRKKLAQLIGDAAVSTTNKDVTDLRGEAENLGSLEEQCRVFLHEFNRCPEEIFRLTLGDVVFFELMPPRKSNG